MNPLKVVYEDSHLIVVDKPSGQAVIPGRGLGDAEPLVDQVTKYLKKKALVVHRIDRETSGLVVFAKDAETHRALNLLWEGREVQKTYLALVKGEVTAKEGVIDHPLRAFGSGRMGVDRKGRSSRTRYRVQETYPGATLLEVEPETGRRHQIRVHLFHLGHPVMGDPLYGSERPVGGAPRLMLHAHRLVIPVPDKALHLTAQLPDDFQNVLIELKP
jgi:tRNA pseudouridine32 synthase / 23S rRNA pseudouridine746 synthase